MNWKNEVILITGASSGLGRALALIARELGSIVILIARNKKRLEETSKKINGKSYCFPFDLQNIGEIPILHKRIVEKVGRDITILFNNVGYQFEGFIRNTPIHAYEKILKVNTLAPLALIQCVLPGMIKQKKGLIANVYSCTMHHAYPAISGLCASKKALEAIHQSLKAELHGLPVKTLYITPGSMRTNYWKNTEIHGIENYKFPSDGEGQDPIYVAKKIYKAIEQGKDKFILEEIKVKIVHHLSYWNPRLLNKIIVRKNRKLLEYR